MRTQVLREMREALTPGERSRLNFPITARKRVENALKARQGGTGDTVKVSPAALLEHQIIEQAHEIAELQRKLARQADGSLFDLRRDTANNIATAIVMVAWRRGHHVQGCETAPLIAPADRWASCAASVTR